MSRVKDDMFTDQEPDESLDPDPVYDGLFGHKKETVTVYPVSVAGTHIADMFCAISKAQGEIVDATKDQQAYGYKYADLSQVLSIGRPILSKYGLAVVQIIGAAGDYVELTTMLVHEKGGMITGKSSMPVHIPTKKDGTPSMSHAQAVGSISTYLRRYSYSAMVGITQSDTDAQAEPEKPKARATSKDFQKPTPNPDIIRALLACEDMRTLQEMWSKLSKSEHKLYEGVKEQRKSELQKLSTVDEDIPQ